MNFPVVYDVLMRKEIEAKDPKQALQNIAHFVATFGIEKAVSSAFEIIRDDNAFPPKDVHSRHTNGFAVLTSSQKLDLVAKISAALDAAGRGDPKPGQMLLSTLAGQFAYMNNSELRGVQV